MTQLKTLPTYDPSLFEGASEVYAQYRTKYPPEVFDKLTEIFHLNGQGRLLDLGTGPGLIAIALRNKFEEVIAIDPDPEMLQEAQQQAASVAANNITWTVSSYLGYLYTTAFSLKIFYGDKAEEFEADIKEALLAVEPSGHFTETLTGSIQVVWKN